MEFNASDATDVLDRPLVSSRAASEAIATPAPTQNTRCPNQQTLASQIEIQGPGLHTGRVATLKLIPAPVGHGLRFMRTDLKNGARLIFPRADAVTQTQLCTLLSNSHGGEVGTIEHLMAALHAAGITNLLIEIDGPEVPILDGSSAPFTRAIAEAGIIHQAAKQTFLRVIQSVEVREGEKLARLAPHPHGEDTRLTLDFDIDFSARCIGAQSRSLTLGAANFADQVSAARTFGFVTDLTRLRAQGLAQGGHMGNAIVIDGDEVQNPEGLRFADEFVRHKLLDAVGDLFIEGLPVIGAYTGVRAGHALTNRLMRKLMANPNSFERVTL